MKKPPPDASWVEMCICCPGYRDHVSQWRKFKDRLRRKAK